MERTAGSRSWLLLGAAAVFAMAQPVACRPDGGGDSSPAAAAQTDALAQVGPGVVLPALDRMAVEVSALQSALDDWAATPEDDDAHTAAQAAWVAVFGTWQELEVMQIGPAASSLTAIAGEDLRDEIYSWPTINACRVDQETVEAGWNGASWFTENLVNSYGLDAIEYMLWAPPGNDCPSQVPINEDGTWTALGDAGVAANRADFSVALAAQIARQVGTLQDRWDPDGGDFSGALARSDGTPYDTGQDATNAVFDALFYLETSTKDRKLALPLGLQDCGVDDCLDTAEALPSGQGAPAIAANLRGFRSLFTGADGDGMDDLLTELGEDALVTQLLVDLDDAITLADAIDQPLDQVMGDDAASVEQLYDAIKRVSDVLKGDIATVLTLVVPAEAAGDND